MSASGTKSFPSDKREITFAESREETERLQREEAELVNSCEPPGCTLGRKTARSVANTSNW
jgi:hypothetical protein